MSWTRQSASLSSTSPSKLKPRKESSTVGLGVTPEKKTILHIYEDKEIFNVFVQPGGESMAGLEVNSSSKLDTSSSLLRRGMNGGAIFRSRTSFHLTPEKNLCSLTARASLSPAPSLLSTVLLSNFFRMSFALGVR